MTEAESADRSEKYLRAILLLNMRPHLEEAKRGSLEALLFRAGFPHKEIVELTGTPKSTVSVRLKAEGLGGGS